MCQPENQEDITLRLRAKQREQDRIQRMKIEEKRRANKEKRDAESKFTTKKVDYSQKHLVRIDSKTYFYINPGENEQEARKKFMETYSKSFKKEDEHASPKEIITKVCRRCKEDKPIKRFYRDTRSTDTRESVCIDCREEQKLLGKKKKQIVMASIGYIRSATAVQLKKLRMEDDSVTVCAHFGCNKRLTLQERLCGRRCVDHPRIIRKPYFISLKNGIENEEVSHRGRKKLHR